MTRERSSLITKRLKKRPRATQRAGGFTLLESLIAAVVLAGAISAVVWPFSVGAQNELASERRTLASCLAQELMEEVLSKPFDDPDGDGSLGPDGGESTRADYDNIDDYHGYTEDAGQIQSFDGEVMADGAGAYLSRNVTTGYVYVSGQDVGEDPTFISVTVEVQYRGLPIATMTRLVYSVQ